MKSIFIQIPSYRDFELNKTIASAVNNASGEIFLSFGIHLCLLFESEIILNQDYPSWVSIKYQESIAPNDIGLQKARYIANEFYNGEDYYFQIDSHMRFAKNWDLKAIDMINYYIDNGIEKPLMTMYPPGYFYKEDGKTEYLEYNNNFTKILFIQDKKQFSKTLIPLQTAYLTKKNCSYTYSVSGGCIFTFGSFAKIKPNCKIVFWGEEPLIAARAFTHGFDLVVLTEYLVWHLYALNQPYSKIRRNHVWKDFPDLWNSMVKESNKEYKKIFLENIIGDSGFGVERSLADYEEFAGLNFNDGKIFQDKWEYD